MNDDDLPDEDEEEALVRMYAARHAQVIISKEGAALAASARKFDEKMLEEASQQLAVAIAQAIVDAYYGDIEAEELRQ